VVIRSKDEAENIGRTLDLVAASDVDGEIEIVVVDSGSTDGTDAIARERGAHVISIPAESFTYGGALNTGTAAAHADIVVALSAHAFPSDPGWLGRMIAAFDDPAVACAAGADRDPERAPLTGPVVQDAALAARHPSWGYSSAAGAFRRALWEERPFRAELPGSEDKEWAWFWLQRGRTVVIDPALCVEHTHSKDPARDLFVRAHREWVGLAMFLDVPPVPLRETVREWWCEQETYRSRRRARLSHRRAARLAGRYVALSRSS
jgi:rhamnosyltransferase